MMKRELNLDIPGSVATFEMLIQKVLPKNIFYKILYGTGFEFDGYRDFAPDGDAGNIDWKASKRAERLLARKYIEERDLKILFLIDVSDNMIFGSAEKVKCEYAAELVSALSHLILFSGDRVGFMMFNNSIVQQRVYGFGERQFKILEQEISDPLNYGGISDLNHVLVDVLGQIDKSTSMVFIVSDFIRLNHENKKNLSLLSSLFETVALVIRDPLDFTFPDFNKEVIVEDPETNEKIFLNPKVAKRAYEENALRQTQTMKNIFQDFGIDFMEFNTEEPFALNLAEFLKQRSEKRIYRGVK